MQEVSIEPVLSQFTKSTVKAESDCLIVTIYPVIGDPPLFGSIHDITTSSGFQAVTGAAGWKGI